MATTVLQQARQRRMIYLGAIVVLFTVSLIHREFVVKAQAVRLQLRETVRGEVELTSSAVRLMLTGSRGLAVTMLWYTAIDKQKRHEWHELELVIQSITKLQPYFITPWLFQSWNIAFNISVENDRSRDKYYYITRGLELLAEGERRNRGVGDEAAAAKDPNRVVVPGNPDLRDFMGTIYQMKIGNSDERLTMRSLLEMSCIDPLERDPDRRDPDRPGFLIQDDKGAAAVNMTRMLEFAQKHPRLVRRLHEQLGYDPPRIIQFLRENHNIPGRFKPIDKSRQARESELKDPQQQFPYLPPRDFDLGGHWPDARNLELTAESIDVFVIVRTWFEFAQGPLPPTIREPVDHAVDYDKLKFRIPRGMMLNLFRMRPPRASAYIAEALESEGFFDADGWNITSWYLLTSDYQALQSEMKRRETAVAEYERDHQRDLDRHSPKHSAELGELRRSLLLTYKNTLDLITASQWHLRTPEHELYQRELKEREDAVAKYEKQKKLELSKHSPEHLKELESLRAALPRTYRDAIGFAESQLAVIFGTDPKYHSRQAWIRAHQAFKKFGEDNGIYLTSAELVNLTKQAEAARQKMGIKDGFAPPMPPDWRGQPLEKSHAANQRLAFSEYYRALCNFDTFFYQPIGESDPLTILMRKKLFALERARKREGQIKLTPAMMRRYDEVWDLFSTACFKHPRFSRAPLVQEDIYEVHLKLLQAQQLSEPAQFRNAALAAAKLSWWPQPTLPSAIATAAVGRIEADPQEMLKVVGATGIKTRMGILDRIQFYDGPEAVGVKEGLASFLQNSSVASGIRPIYFPNYQYRLLTRATPFGGMPVPDTKLWQPLIDEVSRGAVRGRLGLN